jgi:two-component system cell cycle response regulator
MAMTQLNFSPSPLEMAPRDSSVVPKDDDFTRVFPSVMPRALVERIVVVSAEPTSQASICALLDQDGYDLSFATPESILEIAPQLETDVLLLIMAEAPEATLSLCRTLRLEPSTCQTTIILLAEDGASEDQIASGLIAGADDCVTGSRTTELLARVRVQLRHKSHREALARVRGERDTFRREALLDPLTRLPNRKALFAALRDTIDRREPFAVLFLDLDHFKSVNDELGHAMGDEVLRGASACLKQHSRTNDYCGRFGGEEFLLLLDGANGSEAMRAANRHRRAIERLQFLHPRGQVRITASVGVAIYDPDHPSSIDELLGLADAALYEAKRTGRNRALLADRTQFSAASEGA